MQAKVNAFPLAGLGDDVQESQVKGREGLSALMVYALLSVSLLMVAGRWLIRRVLGR